MLQPGQTCRGIYTLRQLIDLAVSPFPRANRGWEGIPANQDPFVLLPFTGVSMQHQLKADRFRHSGSFYQFLLCFSTVIWK